MFRLQQNNNGQRVSHDPQAQYQKYGGPIIRVQLYPAMEFIWRYHGSLVLFFLLRRGLSFFRFSTVVGSTLTLSRNLFIKVITYFSLCSAIFRAKSGKMLISYEKRKPKYLSCLKSRPQNPWLECRKYNRDCLVLDLRAPRPLVAAN